MKLHTDKDAFEAIIIAISNKTNYRQDVIEKDYYVTLLLKELADKQDILPAYFKGGTALYKSMKSIRRFSEDIDLTVYIDDCSSSQAKKRLELSANGYKELVRTTNKSLESNAKGSITSVYDYNSICNKIFDELQRFGHVKIESTSFTISEPYEKIIIEPILYTKATNEQRKILENVYGVYPFEINTIKIERIFVDKIFASQFYYVRELYFDVAKHIYDLTVLMKNKKIKNLVANKDNFLKIISYKRKEENFRIGSNLANMKFEDFTVFASMNNNIKLINEFDKMQEIYVFDDSDKLKYEYVCDSMCNLRKILLTLG